MNNKKIITLLAALLMIATAGVRLSHAQPDTKPAIADPLADFNQAAGFYKEGKFDQAVAMYEALAAKGTPSAALLYDLGNSYYRAQKPGLALISYERALRQAPRDSDIRYNAAFIRQTAGEPDPGFAQYMLSILTGFVSLNEAAVASIILLYFCVILGTIWLFRGYRAALWSVFFSAILFAAGAGILALKVQDEIITRHAVVTAGPAEVRNGPDMNETVGFSLPEGRSIEVLSVQGDWTAISIKAEGLKGWVATKNIQTI